MANLMPNGRAGQTAQSAQTRKDFQQTSRLYVAPARSTELEINGSNHSNIAIPIDDTDPYTDESLHSQAVHSISASNGHSNGLVNNTVRSHHRMSERQLTCWIFVGLLVFTLAWKITIGGYRCSMLLFFHLFMYVYHAEIRHLLVFVIIKHLLNNIKENIDYVIRMEQKPLILVLAYGLTKVGLHIFRPNLENSNGSPLSLILFTFYFITIFILPSLIITAQRAATCIVKGLKNGRKLNREWIIINSFFRTVSRWKKCILFTVIAVSLSYVLDGDLTCILRYFGHGSSCWPLLIPQSLRHSLPYPLQHAWFKGWHQVFRNYKPSGLVKEMIHLGREMEVIHLLPMLIGTYVLSQLLLPRENWIIKKVLFGCISGVVLSGVTSGAMKMLLHRYRPNAYGNPYMWTGPGTATVNHLAFSKLDLSFPCGHTTVSTSIATCLYFGVMHNLQLSHSSSRSSLMFKAFLVVCVYFYPVIVLVSRISECNHWTSDAIFGVS